MGENKSSPGEQWKDNHIDWSNENKIQGHFPWSVRAMWKRLYDWAFKIVWK